MILRVTNAMNEAPTGLRAMYNHPLRPEGTEQCFSDHETVLSLVQGAPRCTLPLFGCFRLAFCCSGRRFHPNMRLTAARCFYNTGILSRGDDRRHRY